MDLGLSPLFCAHAECPDIFLTNLLRNRDKSVV